MSAIVVWATVLYGVCRELLGLSCPWKHAGIVKIKDREFVVSWRIR